VSKVSVIENIILPLIAFSAIFKSFVLKKSTGGKASFSHSVISTFGIVMSSRQVNQYQSEGYLFYMLVNPKGKF